MNYTCISDKELLTMLSNDDVEAFDEVYRRYWSNMFNSAYNILRDKDSCRILCKNYLYGYGNIELN